MVKPKTVRDFLKRFDISATCIHGESSSEFINRISREYGIYILDSRSIPAFTDGLKTSQRIALWLMRNKADKIKTLSLAGEMISSNLYVHGDASACDAIGMLAAPFCNNIPYLEDIGDFGTKAAPTSFSAPRYTYVKRSRFAQDALYIDLDIVPMVENYDGSASMPGTFLPLIPLVLLNGVKGMAIGWSTNILPRSFADLKQAVEDVLQHGKVQKKLMPQFEQYDVEVRESDESPNKYIVVGKLERKNTSTVLITELPPDIKLETFKERLIKLEEDGEITGWTEGRKNKIEIKMRRADLAAMTDADLIELFRIRSYMTERIVVLHESRVLYYETAEELIEDWVKWRLGFYLTRYQYLLKREEERSIYWLCVLACFEGTKKHKPVPESVMEIEGRATLKEYIQEIVELHDLPVLEENLDKIASIPVYKWTVEGYNEAIGHLEDAERKTESYQKIVSSERRRKAIFRKEVERLNQ